MYIPRLVRPLWATAANEAVSTPRSRARPEVMDRVSAAVRHRILEMIARLLALPVEWAVRWPWPLAVSAAGAPGGARSPTKVVRGSLATRWMRILHPNQRSLSTRSHTKPDAGRQLCCFHVIPKTTTTKDTNDLTQEPCYGVNILRTKILLFFNDWRMGTRQRGGLDCGVQSSGVSLLFLGCSGQEL